MAQVLLMARPLVVPTSFKIVNHTSTQIPFTRSSLVQGVIMSSSITRRRIQTSSHRPSPPSPTVDAQPVASVNSESRISDATMARHPLAILPLSTVVRTLGTTAISSSPVLLPPSLAIMNMLAHTNYPVLNPDKNPLLRFVLKKTFYKQFCAGENAGEVRETVNGLKRIGFTGVILGYAREVVLTEEQQADLSGCGEGAEAEECIRNEIIPWCTGTMETVKLAQPGDFVALKFSGAGRQALYALKNRLPPSKELKKAIDNICNLAHERDVPLLFDAEQTAIQAGIDDWTIQYQRKYNTVPGHALIYGTYQAYLKSTPATLASHLALASKEGFTMGVKLVRGAYLGSDPREIIHDTKADTDSHYNAIASALIRRQWNSILAPPPETPDVKFPLVSVLVASHNLETVRKARSVRDSMPAGEGCTELAIAQLQGMADEVSCELLAVKRGDQLRGEERTRAYKYIVWGSTGECMKYLFRRAQENKDAVQRTLEGRNAMWSEVKRRFWGLLGRG